MQIKLSDSMVNYIDNDDTIFNNSRIYSDDTEAEIVVIATKEDSKEQKKSSVRINVRGDNEEMLKKELEITKRMLDRSVKLKNKYKSDLDICQN